MQLRMSLLKEWLDQLEQNSWELELIISGLAIFGLFSVKESLDLFTYKIELLWQYTEYGTLLVFVFGFSFLLVEAIVVIWHILVINLVVHAASRGVWIGAIGLRYVSREIDFAGLRYPDTYRVYLVNNVGNYDIYVERLEKWCSSLFSYSFLLCFSFLSFTILFVVLLFGSAGGLLMLQYLPGCALLLFLTLIIVSIWSLIFALDFFSMGWIKRKLKGFYFPWYRILGVLTLSMFYRPLYYNFIDNKYGRRLFLSTFPYFVVVFLVVDFDHNHLNFSNHFPTLQLAQSNSDGIRIGSEYSIDPCNYLDMRDWRKCGVVGSPLLYSFENDGMIEVFVPYSIDLKNAIVHFCDSMHADLTFYDHVGWRDPGIGLESRLGDLTGCYRELMNFRIGDRIAEAKSVSFTRLLETGDVGLRIVIPGFEFPADLYHLEIETCLAGPIEKGKMYSDSTYTRIFTLPTILNASRK